MLEKMEVGKDAKECFAEIGEYRKMQDRLLGQMMQLDSPKVKKSMKEFRNRHCKTMFHKITEHNGFKNTFERIIFSFPCTPLNYSLTLEKPHSLQFLYSCFGHFALALARGEISNFFIINLGLALLVNHLSVMSYNLKLGGYDRG